MTKLSDTQTIILSAAAQRDDGNVLPLPGSLRGGAATKVVGALLSRGLIAERITDSEGRSGFEPHLAQRAGRARGAALHHPGWARRDRRRAACRPGTSHGRGARHRRGRGRRAGAGRAAPKKRGGRKKTAPTGADTAAPRKSRDGTKQAQVIAMLRCPGGATIAQIAETTDWRPHYADVRIMPM
jgi:hypothetical protein